ncbi:hypothetical protein N0V88_003075 [Collariella sp. IMI 366227]|nr:hypothetical protein N0V88_003075 [Collariella sp. IMI 366227]
MSVFSMIKRGRRAAKEHRAERAEKEKKEAEKAPYRHVPKHAAIDALSGGPAGWRENDRVRIVEQNRRRSAMTASGMGMSGTMTPVHMALPRIQSALSNVSYPAAYASPIVQMPRAYSYSSSMPPGWTPTGREMSYSPIDSAAISLKGKEVERILDSSRTSRSSSKVSTGRIPLPPGYPLSTGDAMPSPAESSSNSNSSQDDLEMKPVTRHSVSIPPSASPVRQSREVEHIHRLAPGRSRRISDPNQLAASSRSSRGPRTSSLAPGIPPVPAIPPMQFGAAITTPEVFSSASSSASSITMVPVGSTTSLSAAKYAPSVATPTVLKVKETKAPLQAEVVLTESSEEEEVTTPTTAPVVVADSPTKRGRRPRVTRFTELETIKSDSTVTIEPVSPISKQPTRERDERKRPTAKATALPTNFDESALPSPKEIVLPISPSPAQKSGKLSKPKKNRWSLRSSKNSVAAC